jgi:hypothetical protein
VQASTMTTLWPIMQARPELCVAVLKATMMGVHFFKTQVGPMWEVMQQDVAKELKIDSEEVLRALFLRNQAILEPRLYPRAEAIANAFELAVMEEPAVAEALNPMSLWDVHLLRELEESGFVDELYGGQVPGPGSVLAR